MDSNKIKKGLGRGLSSLIGETKIEENKNKIPITDLIPNKYQPRKNFDQNHLEDLTNSIRERGMIQPIIVRKSKTDNTKFEIIAGERRWLAAQKASLHNVPVVVMEADDLKFATEGGGGGFGDPLLLVQKYFGPRVASAVAKLDSPDDIQKFAENLVKIKDAKGNSVTSRFFDPDLIDPNDFEFADGGRVPMFAGGAARMGFQALRKYGIQGKDISRLFASLGTDKSLVGKEKTEYFRTLNQVLKNPDKFPDEIMDIQKQLGIDVGLGLKSGGLAGILEV